MTSRWPDPADGGVNPRLPGHPAAPVARDWVDWHQAYEDPGSALSGRLRAVQAHLRAILDRQPPGPSA